MKIRLSLLCIALAIIAFNVADAQHLGRHSIGDGAFAQPVAQRFSGDLLGQRSGVRPGRLWFEANVADQGLGFNGSYLTIGGKSRLFEDRLDGRWLMEGQVHHSLEEEGGLFANIGIERVFSIPAAEADVSFGVWYDYNGDRQTNFSHTFHQVGISGSIKTRKWDLLANGYLPTGIQDYAFGDPSGANCFVGNQIVLVPGIDSALQGFDVALRLRPKQMAFANGTVDFGGYHYNSDLIDAFAGARVRLGFQALSGMMVNLEVNHDDRFDTTGILGVGWQFGANASGHGSEYSPLGRDLERTSRNDHIAIFNRDVVLAFDPETGAPYNVVHVDNNADPAGQNGTAERPYSTLVAAQNLSANGDVILVNSGDGTDRGMDTGIILQDDQRLWGNGQALLIPVQDGQFFQLCTDPSGVTPTISNDGGFAVVTLADNNDVAGINIDANGATHGIFGNGRTASIRDNTIANATSDGVLLGNMTGDISIARNSFTNNGRNGLFLFNALDTTSEITFEDNVATGNLLDGIHIRNYDPASISMLRNTTSNNLRSGLYMENFLNTTGASVDILSHTSLANASNGIHMNRGSGNLNIFNSNVQNNGASGILVENWSTAGDERIRVGATEGGVSTISGNGAFANLSFLMNDPGAQSSVIVSDQSLSDGVRGLAARVEGVNGAGVRTTLDIDIIDNVEINRNINDGISLAAFDSGLIRAQIGNTTGTAPLQMIDNAIGGGAGIAIVAQGVNGQPQAEVQATIDNVTINNAVSRVLLPGNPLDVVVFTDGVSIDSIGNGLVDVELTNSQLGGPNFPNNINDRDTQRGVRINLDNNGSELINRINIDNIIAFSDLGVSMFTGTDTYTDFTLANSTLLPNGVQTAGARADDNVHSADGLGINGVSIVAVGGGTITGQTNWNAGGYGAIGAASPTNIEVGVLEVVSDGDLDNLTKVSLIGNTIQDFTLEGVDIETNGDAQMLLNIVGNQITNNGAGAGDDINNDHSFGNEAIAGVGNPARLLFFDGVNINAFDASQISTRISGNTFLDNFERGLSLNTFNTATINAVLENNTFFGNDRGNDTVVTNPPVGTGTAAGFVGNISTVAFADLEAINNEEYYDRNYETLILIAFDDGAPIDLTGTDLAADLPGFSSIGGSLLDNVGSDLFGAIALGTAELNLSMSNNALQLGPELVDLSVPGGDFQLGLDGLTNGFGPGQPGITDVAFPNAGFLIGNEEAFFGVEGF